VEGIGIEILVDVRDKLLNCGQSAFGDGEFGDLGERTPFKLLAQEFVSQEIG
jgi:hypothetical protein